ncbi:unnamed protein product [Rotaria magnacalcarata]|uniref:Uncharacterized protein n=3 Tax=Rotaria magnacalcarata TaxID=392030 RepID=A0A820HDG8_9BILA|nr:unnamed protein product [Rotaria magnacalcarata]
MVLYSIFVFTMNIVIMNIMVGLVVSDVKRFCLNAKREHSRSRIEICLGLQVEFGLLCETRTRLVLALLKHGHFLPFQLHHHDRAGDPLLQENEHIHLMHRDRVDELHDVFEKSNTRVHHELRKFTIALQTDFDEIKKKLLETNA